MTSTQMDIVEDRKGVKGLAANNPKLEKLTVFEYGKKQVRISNLKIKLQAVSFPFKLQ